MSILPETRFLPFLSKPTEDLLMWRDPKKTGILFGIVNVLFFFFFFTKTPFVSIVLYTIGGSVALLTAWARFGTSVGRPMPALPAFLREGVSEVDYKSYMDRVKPYVDSALSHVGYVVSCRNFAANVKIVAGCFFFGKALSYLNPFTLAYILILIAFIAPKAYEQNKEVVDDYLAKGKDQANKYVAMGKEHYDRGISSAQAKVSEYSQKVPALKPLANSLNGRKKAA